MHNNKTQPLALLSPFEKNLVEKFEKRKANFFKKENATIFMMTFSELSLSAKIFYPLKLEY